MTKVGEDLDEAEASTSQSALGRNESTRDKLLARDEKLEK